MRRDPFESPLISTALLGSVLLVATAFSFVRALLLFRTSSAGSPEPSGVLRLGAFAFVFALGAGCSTAWTRRFLLSARSLRTRNLVTGGLSGLWYAAGCYVFFEHDLPPGMGTWIVLGFTFLGISYAVASGLNQAFRELGRGER